MIINKTAIILAGGRGSRLGELTQNTPKPLLPVAGRSFIFYLLDYLNDEGIREVILSVGYLGDQFQEVLGNTYKNISIKYSIETVPLGTGGALGKALKMTSQENVFVFNGDTLFKSNLQKLEEIHERAGATLSLVLRYVEERVRYGGIDFESELVVECYEKGLGGAGYVNGGIYLVQKKQWPSNKKEKYSFEVEVLPWLTKNKKVACLKSNGYFIDIGISEDLERSQKELQKANI